MGIRCHLDQLCKYLNNICARMKNNNSNFMYVIVVLYFTNTESIPILLYTARQWIKFNKNTLKNMYIYGRRLYINNVLLLVSLCHSSLHPSKCSLNTQPFHILGDVSLLTVLHSLMGMSGKSYILYGYIIEERLTWLAYQNQEISVRNSIQLSRRYPICIFPFQLKQLFYTYYTHVGPLIHL